MRNRSAALLLAVELLLSGPMTAAGAGPASHTVTMEGTSFDPPELTVKAGDTVVWVNKDPFPHTATSQAGGFDSKSIAPGRSWKYRPTRAGVYPYVCTLHPTMKGTLRVAPASGGSESMPQADTGSDLATLDAHERR